MFAYLHKNTQRVELRKLCKTSTLSASDLHNCLRKSDEKLAPYFQIGKSIHRLFELCNFISLRQTGVKD